MFANYIPEIWMAVNPKKKLKVTKHDTKIKIYKTQQNLRWSVS